MRSRVVAAVAALLMVAAGLRAAESASPRVALETSKGRIVLELDSARSPETVKSFLQNVTEGFYDGTLFHRVRKDFMVQGGGFDKELRLKPTDKLLANEADNGLSNTRGTVAMARKNDPHSASVQFFINTVDNLYLDFTRRDARGWGYTVFGRVVDGMDVVDAIGEVAVQRARISEALPVEPVVIEKAKVLLAASDVSAPAEE